MSAPISIIIPAFNQLEYCRQCIASIQIATERSYKLILVDNGSTDGVGAYFDSIAGATVVHSAANVGFAAGVNLGLEHCEGHALLLNSDTLVPNGWLERLEGALLQADDIGMVGPRSNCVSGSQQIDDLQFNEMTKINAFTEELSAKHAGEVRDVARLVGFCLLIRDEVVEAVGHWDEAYGTGNFEDDDYCLRVLRSGYRLCVAEDSFVFHYGSRTFVGMGIVDVAWGALIKNNAQVFQDKWDAEPAERSDAIQQSRQLNKAAQAAARRGEYAESLRLLRDAIVMAPTYDLNYNDLGAVLWEVGEHERAYEAFRHALELNAESHDARENLEDAAKALGKEKETQAFLEGLS